ncbi:MAG: NAD-dependent epimerase/dehydratase family protein [Methanomicrobiales archaeon]|nr:NAD-dependent epimerase/dehydratase family protein [Methanomicrobiales archaeon]
MHSIVTGGAGFIGSHLVDRLVRDNWDVTVIDDCSSGSTANLQRHLESRAVNFLKKDLNDDGWQHTFQGADRVFHLAADPDVKESARDPSATIRNNFSATVQVLDAMHRYDVPSIAFTSTSTVYGDASVIPTPETYGPLAPISVYGGTKLASEAMIAAYCGTWGMEAQVFRFANIIGERSNHGVCWDFIRKLRQDPAYLEILGDGRQAKSYLEVHECVDAMLHISGRSAQGYQVYNIGSEDWVDVSTIADIVTREMGLSGVDYRFSGGTRGWVGDVPRMLLSIEKAKVLGWRPRIGSQESIRIAVRALLEA